MRVVVSKAVALLACSTVLGIFVPSTGLCQKPPFRSSKVSQQIVESVLSNITTLPKFQEVKKFTTAQQFRNARVQLSGSEIILERLFGRQYPEYVRFGIALRRSGISKGASAVADQELGKLTEITRRMGASWINGIITGLQRSSSCYNSVWVDGLMPLLEMPEGREIVQDYAFRALQRWNNGGTFSWACSTLRSSSVHQQRFAIDLFYLYLYSVPDPVEAMTVYQSLAERITILQTRVSLALAMTRYYDSPSASLKLSDYPPEDYSEHGDPVAIRAIKDALRMPRGGG